MHIPDGYLSPETCGVFGAAMVPVWTTAGRRVRKIVKNRYVPLVALGAAYSFLVMMFNVPILTALLRMPSARYSSPSCSGRGPRSSR
jgi:ABC-type Co2+ transport system permease subunit